MVYALMRGDTCLYVGESGRGLRRLSEIRHRPLHDLEAGDAVLVWDAPADILKRRQLEIDLIRTLKPKWNVVGNSGESETRRITKMRTRCISDFRSSYWSRAPKA